MVSAGEIHHPGRPTDAAGTKALAVLNAKAYANHRPGGAKVHGVTLIVTDDLDVDDVDLVHERGVERTKVVFALEDVDRASRVVSWARELGTVTTMHTGGASEPGTRPIGRPMFERIEPDPRSTSTAGRRRSPTTNGGR